LVYFPADGLSAAVLGLLTIAAGQVEQSAQVIRHRYFRKRLSMQMGLLTKQVAR
jgi:hypothetical protein